MIRDHQKYWFCGIISAVCFGIGDWLLGYVDPGIVNESFSVIHGMVGLSLGGTIAVSVLSRGKLQIERTVLDAAFCLDMGILRGCYGWVFPKGVVRVRDSKYVPGVLIDLFMGRGNRSVVEMIYPAITVETCRNACRNVYSYRISDNLRNTSSVVEFWRGSREAYPEKGVKNNFPR